MATATLLCKQCNFENEPERVYCHNCGAKLDRTLLPPDAIKREDPQVVQDRVRSVVRPKRFDGRQIFKKLVYSLLVAAVLAVLYLISQPPFETPALLSEDQLMNVPDISGALEDVADAPLNRRLAYTEIQVNGFLQSTIKGKEASNYGITTKYERAFVHFTEGLCGITVQESVFGYPFYVTGVDGVDIAGGHLVTHPVAGSIGRLPLPGKLMPPAEKVFAPVWSTFDPYKKLVARMTSLRFHDGSVEMGGKPAEFSRPAASARPAAPPVAPVAAKPVVPAAIAPTVPPPAAVPVSPTAGSPTP